MKMLIAIVLGLTVLPVFATAESDPNAQTLQVGERILDLAYGHGTVEEVLWTVPVTYGVAYDGGFYGLIPSKTLEIISVPQEGFSRESLPEVAENVSQIYLCPSGFCPGDRVSTPQGLGTIDGIGAGVYGFSVKLDDGTFAGFKPDQLTTEKCMQNRCVGEAYVYGAAKSRRTVVDVFLQYAMVYGSRDGATKRVRLADLNGKFMAR